MRIYNPSTGEGGAGIQGATGATGPQGIQGPGGGGGAGGLMFYLNQNTSPDSPTTGLPYTAVGGTSVVIKELGRTADAAQTTITTQHLPTGSYEIMAAFVSDLLDPNITSIPAGLWDINFWASSDANQNNQMSVIAKIYKYNGTAATLIATSDAVFMYDPVVVTQYTLNTVIPAGVTLAASDRIYIELLGKGSSNNYTITLKFGDGTPTHIHTTIPSVSGTGLVKVVDGIPQTPATLLNNNDVAANANITLTKINLNSLLSSLGMSSTAVDTMSRSYGRFVNQTLNGNFVYLMLFTPLIDITAAYLTVVMGTKPTDGNLQLGLYTYDEVNTFTKVAVTAGVAFSTLSAGTVKLALNSPAAYQLTAGTRYAVAITSSHTVGTLALAASDAATIFGIYNLDPVLCRQVNGVNNLNSATITATVNPNFRAFCRVSTS
jgi:hypothetical protein